jgi:hypothetical protein
VNFPKYKAGPVEFWLSEAATQFVNGAIAGFKTGATVGVFSGGGVAASDFANRVSPFMNALIAVGGILATCTAAGINRVIDWHKSNEFPNPYPKPPAPTP